MALSAASKVVNPHDLYVKRRRRELRLAAFSLMAIAAAWLYGYLNTGSDIAPLVKNVLTGAERVVEQNGIFIAYGSDDSGPLGYAATGEAIGYGGPVRMLVGVDPDGQITGVQVIQQSETPGFFNWLRTQSFFAQFPGQQSTLLGSPGDRIDAITGATLSSEAVALSIQRAVGTINVTQSDAQALVIGWPEVTLIALFAMVLVSSAIRSACWKRWLRIGMMAVGVVVLGFILNKPLTVSHFTAFLSGYWPDWHVNLYWYLLLGGVVLTTLVRGKNPYCSWFCPFGAIQECLAAVSGAKPYRPQRLYARLKWLQRGLAFTAIILGLALRQPAATSYEPFGTLFSLSGGFFPWMLLVILLFSSLIIRRPFCSYLCPVDPVIELLGRMRGWILESWSTKRPLRPAEPPSGS
jgi:hypothetical protein